MPEDFEKRQRQVNAERLFALQTVRTNIMQRREELTRRAELGRDQAGNILAGVDLALAEVDKLIVDLEA